MTYKKLLKNKKKSRKKIKRGGMGLLSKIKSIVPLTSGTTVNTALSLQNIKNATTSVTSSLDNLKGSKTSLSNLTSNLSTVTNAIKDESSLTSMGASDLTSMGASGLTSMGASSLNPMSAIKVAGGLNPMNLSPMKALYSLVIKYMYKHTEGEEKYNLKNAQA